MPKIPTCPACQKTFKTGKSMRRHLANLHPDYKPDAAPGPASPAVKPAGLEVKEPPQKKKEKDATVFEGTQGRYHCIDCGGDITKGAAQCPHCGTTLDWSAVE